MLLVFLTLTVAQAQVPVASITLAPSTTINIDLGKLKGKLVRQVAWSPDASELYLMTYDPNQDASIKKAYHFVIPVATGTPRAVDAAPKWAEEYWTWKSGQASPDDASLKIDLVTERRKVSAVALPFGGDLARGGTEGSAAGSGGGLSTESAMAAANASQMSDVRTIKLKGQVVGEWINHPIVPGQTFGWGPKGSGLFAYAEQKSGRLVLMNHAGDRHSVEGTRDVSHPAFSNDGSRLAYLEARGRNRFALVVAAVQK
jgi:hypothetical protein